MNGLCNALLCNQEQPQAINGKNDCVSFPLQAPAGSVIYVFSEASIVCAVLPWSVRS